MAGKSTSSDQAAFWSWSGESCREPRGWQSWRDRCGKRALAGALAWSPGSWKGRDEEEIV